MSRMPRWLRLTATVVVLLVAVGFLTRSLLADGGQSLRALGQLRPLPLLLAFTVVLAGVVITALSWQAPLQAVSRPICSADAIRLFAAGQLGKYAPGAMWSVVLQAQLAARSGITTAQIAVTFGVYALISLASGAAVGLPAAVNLIHGRGWLLPAAAAVALLGLVALPWLLRPVLAGAWRIKALRDKLSPVDGPALRRSVQLCTVSWLVTGVHLWILAVALGVPAGTALLPCVCGFALATALGTVAFVVPDGLGVREGILALVLSTCMPASVAVIIAAASRVLLAAADLVMFGYGSWSVRRQQRTSASPAVLTTGGPT